MLLVKLTVAERMSSGYRSSDSRHVAAQLPASSAADARVCQSDIYENEALLFAPAMSSKPIYFVRRLRQQLKSPWLDSTEWPSVIVSSLATENAFVGRPLADPADNLARAAACLDVVRAAESPLSRTVAPFRVGKIATDSVDTYNQLLHAAAAGHYALQSTSPTADSTEKMRAAGAAWRHLKAAGVWNHERETCPPQLKDDFKLTLHVIILLLTAEVLASKPSPYRIKVFQALTELCGPQSDIYGWASDQLREAVALHWATVHTNPNAANDGAAPNIMLAYAACAELGDCNNDVVAQFLRSVGTVGGLAGLNDARLQLVALGGARGLLEPERGVVEAALPVKALQQGNTTLTRHQLTQAAMCADGQQVVHLQGPGIVLSIANVPKVPVAPAAAAAAEEPSKSRWWPTRPSVAMFKLPSLGSAMSSSSAPVSAAVSSTDFL